MRYSLFYKRLFYCYSIVITAVQAAITCSDATLEIDSSIFDPSYGNFTYPVTTQQVNLIGDLDTLTQEFLESSVISDATTCASNIKFDIINSNGSGLDTSNNVYWYDWNNTINTAYSVYSF